MPRPAARAGGARARSGRPAARRELRARGKQTMRKLLDAGAQVFATKGYHAARVDDIVKVAETSHGTFYLYFSNKEDLFAALAAEVTDAMREVAESLGPLEPGPEGEAALRAWIAQLAAVYEQYGSVIRAWTEAEIGGTEVGRLGDEMLTQFTRVLAKRIAEVAPPGIEPGVASIALAAMVERLNYYVLSRQVKLERDAMVDTLARVVHGSLFGTR